MIYTVHIEMPAINEDVTLAANTEEEARALAVASALNRASQAATVTVEQVPDGAAAG